MKLLYKKSFIKSYNKYNQSIKNKVKARLSIFIENPFDERLHNHWLHGLHQWERSINITGDMRIIFKELSEWKYEIVELIDMWTHSQLYW